MTTKDVTRAERDRMNELLSDRGALQRVMKINRDQHTAERLAFMFDEVSKEYDALSTRARQASQERMARVRAGKGRTSDHEGGEANG